MPTRHRPRPSPRRQRQSADWLTLVQVGGVLLVASVAWFAHGVYEQRKEEWRMVEQWLKDYGLLEYKYVFQLSGIKSLEDVMDVDMTTERNFMSLTFDVQNRIQIAAQLYRDEVILQQWLIENNLQKCISRLKSEDIHSLESFAQLSDVKLREVSICAGHAAEQAVLVQKVAELNRLDPNYKHLKQKQWQDFLAAIGAYKMSLKGVLLFTLFVALVVLGMKLNDAYSTFVSQQGQDPAKHSLLDFVTGSYLSVQKCSVEWHWSDPQTVGKTMSFMVKFFQHNGWPYPVSDSDSVLIEITHNGTKAPPSVKLGTSLASNSFHAAHVSFTVHRAGVYKIAIMVRAAHIMGSPFTHTFRAGTIDPGKSGMVSQSASVVCSQGTRHRLYIELRDSYGNLCEEKLSPEVLRDFRLSLTEIDTQYRGNSDVNVAFEADTKRVAFNVKVNENGIYLAQASINHTTLKNGEFYLLVLTEAEMAMVKKYVSKKSHCASYEARLIPLETDNKLGEKPRKVFCYISSRQLTIKEYHFKIIPKKLYTFRVCPSTKFQYQGSHNQTDSPLLLIDDGNQPPVSLASKDRNVIAATFSSFLLKNIGGSETFKDKQDFFYQELRSLHAKRIHDRLPIKVTRQSLLEGSYRAAKNFSTSDWCRNFEITFQGEEGLDWGGLRREWFELVCVALFDPRGSALFTRFRLDSQALVHPNPKRPGHLKLKYYEFAGKVVGKCLYESALGGGYRQLVKARFTRSFLAQLIGLRVNYWYFEQDDPELFTSKIRYLLDNDVEGMDLVFAEEEYKDGQLDKVVDLIPGGATVAVTNQNKLRYLDCLAQYKLATSIKDEVEAFLKGLNELIPDNLLSMFDENELELLMCGTGNYSVTDFKTHFSPCGYSLSYTKVLEWFWTVVSGFTEEEMARLLQFTTGCSQLPPGGFAELKPKFQIAAAPTRGNLPTAHTCFNQLCLPDYDSMDQLHQALLLAINEGNQGFGML